MTGPGRKSKMTLSIPADPPSTALTDVSGPRSLITVCKVSEVVEGRGHRAEVAEIGPVAVFLLAGQYYVIDDTCTHGAASLSDGEVFGDEIECPFHQGAFNIRSGAPTARPCTKALKTYPVHLRGEQVCIALDSSA